ncbi:MAG: redoxin domain-containing protein [Verrucomicrobia bacterium]|nr:redoxin domain-containing protein [Verrucomicrobiota bacterium]
MKKIRTFLAMLAVAILPAGLIAQVNVGDTAPDFTLTDLQGVEHSLSDFRGKTVVLEFANPNCPFVVKFYRVGAMQRFQKEAAEKGVVWLVVNPTVYSHQDYLNHEQSVAWVEEHNVKVPWMINRNSSVARLYGAARTPEMFIINGEGTIVYMGAIDSISSANSADIERATNYVMQALGELKAGQPISNPRTRPYGCTIKF